METDSTLVQTVGDQVQEAAQISLLTFIHSFVVCVVGYVPRAPSLSNSVHTKSSGSLSRHGLAHTHTLLTQRFHLFFATQDSSETVS